MSVDHPPPVSHKPQEQATTEQLSVMNALAFLAEFQQKIIQDPRGELRRLLDIERQNFPNDPAVNTRISDVLEAIDSLSLPTAPPDAELLTAIANLESDDDTLYAAAAKRLHALAPTWPAHKSAEGRLTAMACLRLLSNPGRRRRRAGSAIAGYVGHFLPATGLASLTTTLTALLAQDRDEHVREYARTSLTYLSSTHIEERGSMEN